ncbi:hypothetical protein RHMOL_Rhmol13G0217800 [Rhododendron molle]|uniref:Uncharacterized protein n=1 Tax=Rhododendron molle TaxID=49168 RepID=A0ACC0LAB0_RHOML|nr:hypothetical protein RHMOL_Rhmol13G0217800 [Rhododendron molle]
MTSLCGGIHIISTNEKEGNVHPLLRRVNKIALVQPLPPRSPLNGTNKMTNYPNIPRTQSSNSRVKIVQIRKVGKRKIGLNSLFL